MKGYRKAAIIAEWTKAPEASASEIAALTGASVPYVCQVRKACGVGKGAADLQPWSDDELADMRANYARLGPQKMMTRVGRSYHAVSRKAERMGVTAEKGGYRKREVG